MGQENQQLKKYIKNILGTKNTYNNRNKKNFHDKKNVEAQSPPKEY